MRISPHCLLPSIDAAAPVNKLAAVTIGRTRFGGGSLGWILGPCSLESYDVSMRVAEHVAALAARLGLGVVFKGSFDKANRTAPGGARGPGLDEGLRILTAVRAATGLSVITDVHETTQVDAVAAVCDAIQIPAFLCRQTDLIAAAAATGKPLLLKKGQFLAPEDMQYAVAKAAGSSGVLLGERGTSFGHRDLIVDYRGLVTMRAFAPVIFDATHSVQQPGAAGGASGGNRSYVRALARAAIAVGIDGIFLETHPNPAEAISDRATQIPLADLDALVSELHDLNARIYT